MIRVRAVESSGPIRGGKADRTGQAARPVRYPCFDGLRAIAALSVIGVHVCFDSGVTGRRWGNYTSRLEIGVDVFFVISGFLLYRPFVAAHFEGGPAVDPKKFLVRRLKRIVPAYWAAFLIISYVMHADVVRHAWYAPFIYLGFAQIYIPYYVVTGVTQAWSLCTEITFYLALPFYAALLARRRRSPSDQLRAELTGLAALVVVGLVYRIPVLMGHSGIARAMPIWLPGYFDVFALGMLLAVVSTWLAHEDRRPAWLWHPVMPYVSWALAAAAFVVVSNIGLPRIPVVNLTLAQSLPRQTLFGLFGFFMVAPAVFGNQNRGLIRRGLALRPVAAIGTVSYGIYLWHQAWIHMFLTWTGDRIFTFPVMDMVAAAVPLTIASATLSYVLVEKPILSGVSPVAELRRRMAGVHVLSSGRRSSAVQAAPAVQAAQAAGQ